MFAHFAVQKDCNQFGLLPAIYENSFSASLSIFAVQLMAWCRDAVAHCAFWNTTSHICSEPAVALYFTQSKSLMRQGPVTLPTPLLLCPSLTMLQPHWPSAPGTWWAYCILLLLCLIPLLGIIFLHISTKQTPWLVSSLCSDLSSVSADLTIVFWYHSLPSIVSSHVADRSLTFLNLVHSIHHPLTSYRISFMLILLSVHPF